MFKFALIATVSAVQLSKETLPYGQTDYGVAAGSTQHEGTMAWANARWAEQNAGVSGQQSGDVWRGQGLKAAWGDAPNPQLPKIAFSQKSTLPYGQTDYGVAGGVGMHAGTMDWANAREAERTAGVNGQQSSDVWRNTGPKAAWGDAPNPQLPKIAAQMH